MTKKTALPATTATAAGSRMTKAAAAAKKKRDRHVFKGRVDPDGTPEVTDLGDGALSVTAYGRHALGERSTFTIEASDWERVRTAWGDQWVVVPNGRKSFYLGSGRREAIRDVDQDGKTAVAVLARLLMGAERGEVVAYLDLNPANLRRANLRVISKAAAALRRVAVRQAHYEAILKDRCPDIWASIYGSGAAAAEVVA